VLEEVSERLLGLSFSRFELACHSEVGCRVLKEAGWCQVVEHVGLLQRDKTSVASHCLFSVAAG
jgi:hypothetical protein